METVKTNLPEELSLALLLLGQALLGAPEGEERL